LSVKVRLGVFTFGNKLTNRREDWDVMGFPELRRARGLIKIPTNEAGEYFIIGGALVFYFGLIRCRKRRSKGRDGILYAVVQRQTLQQ
jgi:hypothetical protein